MQQIFFKGVINCRQQKNDDNRKSFRHLACPVGFLSCAFPGSQKHQQFFCKKNSIQPHSLHVWKAQCKIKRKEKKKERNAGAQELSPTFTPKQPWARVSSSSVIMPTISVHTGLECLVLTKLILFFNLAVQTFLFPAHFLQFFCVLQD